MNKISNYSDLVLERKRIELALKREKNILKEDIEELKEKFQPLLKVISFFGGSKTNDQPVVSLLKQGSSLGVDFLIRDKLLGKVGWITRMLASTAVKGVLSAVINRKAKNNGIH